MRTARALATPADSTVAEQPPVSEAGYNAMSTPSAATTTSNVSSIGAYGDSFALTHRIAARLNASSASTEEFDEWIKEREQLLDRHFSGEMSARDRARLKFVEWNIDRIEDAKNGHELDVLEGFTLRYEKFRDDMAAFFDGIEASRAQR